MGGMTSETHYWGIRRLGEAYRRGETTPTAVTAALLERIAREDPRLRAYAHVAPELAMAQAEQAERELAAHFDRGPLHGIPIALKDLCATRDMPTHAGMPRLPPQMPGQDSTVAVRLRRAGAILPGKLQMSEGATGAHHPDVTPPHNPWSPDLWTGISSSGSGVAVAAGLCQAALGSDTGGSIRFPSVCCGLTGLKPTWGRVSRAGVFPCAESMDHIGPMARSAEDAAYVLAAIAGPDPADPSASVSPPPHYPSALAGDLAGLAVGLDAAFVSDDVDAEVSAAVLAAAQLLAELGAAVRPVSFPRRPDLLASSVGGFLSEIAIAHEATFPRCAAAYGPDLSAILEGAHTVTAKQVVQADRARIALRREVDALLSQVSLLILPAQPFVTPSAEDGLAVMRDTARQQRATRFTVVFDLTGHPTITLPCGFDRRGYPIGMQLVGRSMDEALLLRTAHAFQQVTDHHTRRP